MNYITIVGEFTEEILKKFIDDYSKVVNNGHITIYLSSHGGLTSVYNIILDIINQNSENITLIATDEIQSAAFMLFFFAKCNKYILEGTIGMAHYTWTVMSINETGKPTSESEKFLLKELKGNRSIVIDKYKEIGLNTAELKKIESGKDCFFSYKRLLQLIEHGKEN